MRRLAVVPFLLLVACVPEEGDHCSVTMGDCRGPHEALWCKDGVMTRVRCDGERGCEGNLIRIDCDQSVGSEGDVCVGDDGGSACSADGTQFLQCRSGRMELVAHCRGPAGCHREGTQVLCDESRAQAGDHCTGTGSACGPDGHQLLDCRDGRFVVRHATDSCAVQGGSLSWTGSQAVLNEPCTNEGGNACGGDRMLVCQNGAMTTRLTCHGPRGCYPDDSSGARMVRCDQSVGSVGEVCEGEGAACTADGSMALRCENGRFVRSPACTGGCVLRDGTVYCAD